MKKKVCGAKLRGKNAHCQKSPMANGRCRLHGGATPSGPDSANFIHGRYAEVFKTKMANKFAAAQNEKQPLDFMPELHAQRALFEQYVEGLSNRRNVKLTELVNASTLAQDVVRTGAMINKVRNDKALTIAEIRFIQKGMIMLLERYVPDPNKRRNFIADLNALIPERHAADEDEPAELPAGTG